MRGTAAAFTPRRPSRRTLAKGTLSGRIWSFGVEGSEKFVAGFREVGGSGRSISVAGVELGSVAGWFCATCIAGWG